ncbi:MAG: CPBP family intramembrane metalloprotease [Ignavibacteriales bacterium]|nr:CPBP family intramembrane metalloprotease [Ignavibacteriales bacterium]
MTVPVSPAGDSSYPQSSGVSFDGSWERSGRSLNSSALLALLGIGVLYFNGQSLLAIVAVFIGGISENVADGGYFHTLLRHLRDLADPLRVAIVLSQYLLMLLPTVLLVRRWHSSDVRLYIRFTGSRVSEIALALLATLMIIPSSNFIADELVRQLGIPDELMQVGAELFTARSPVEFVWLVFVVCLTPALCEEIFFRGFVQRTFERTMGWKSVVLVGGVFGLFHFNPLGLISLSILGLLFGYFYYRSRSLIPPMVAHFGNNLVAVLVLYGGSQGTAGPTTTAIPLWLVGATLPVGIVTLLWYAKVTVRRERHREGMENLRYS